MQRTLRAFTVRCRIRRLRGESFASGVTAIRTIGLHRYGTRVARAIIALSTTLPSLALGQAATSPAAYVAAADVQAEIAKMRSSLKPGQSFLYRPVVRAGDASAAIEYWLKPGKPAVHPDQAEYVVVLAGGGTMVSGGTMIDAKTTNPTLIEGTRIDGGTTRQLRTGDVFLIAAGTPHWFGITGERLVLLGTKIPQIPK